jgi:5-methylcytosine-specific restriction endonuclease McrA
MAIDECASCAESFEDDVFNPLRLYCSVQCRGVAKAVRYPRGLRERGLWQPGVPLRKDLDDAVRYKIAHALGGGYDANARRIPPATRDLVWERDDGRCVLCGEPGEEIDRIDGSSNDPETLRLVCRPCHHEITNRHLSPVVDPGRIRLARAMP